MTTESLSTVIVAAVLGSSALVGVQVGASQVPASILSADVWAALTVSAPARLVPAAPALKLGRSPVVRIAP